MSSPVEKHWILEITNMVQASSAPEKVDRSASGKDKLLIQAWVKALPVLVLLGFLYHDVLHRVVLVWMTDGDNAHGILLLVVAAYLIFARRKAILRAETRIWSPGLGLILAGSALFLSGLIAVEYYLQRVSLVFLIAGIMGYLWGKEVLRLMLFPLVLLFLAMPLPAIVVNALTLPLKALVTLFAAEMLRISGIVVLQEGNILQLPHITLEVVTACSGIRSVFALFVIALFLSTDLKRLWGKGLLVLSTIPIAIFTNALRIAATGILAVHGNPEKALDFYHGFSGWAVFALALLMLFLTRVLLGFAMQEPKERHETSSFVDREGRP